MTEIEETIKSLEEMFPKGLCEVDEYKMAQVAINALEKQIPKKVIKWANGTEHCPSCDCDNSCVGYGVCIDCGQKLDWSDSD